MVDFFKVVGSIEDIDFLNLDHRSMFISVESTDLAHQNNMMGVTFNLFLVDKCISDDQDSLVISIQENLFVVGQVQDFILSLDQDVEFNEVVVAQAPETEYTSTAAICTFKVLFDKNLSCGESSLDSTYVQEENNGGNESTITLFKIGANDGGTNDGWLSEQFNIEVQNVSAEYENKNLILNISDLNGTQFQFEHTISQSDVYYGFFQRTFNFSTSYPAAGECEITVSFENQDGSPLAEQYQDLQVVTLCLLFGQELLSLLMTSIHFLERQNQTQS